MALMQISIVPLGTGETSLSATIAGAVALLREHKVDHVVTDMGTIVYGEVEELFRVATKIHQHPFNQGARRVLTHITIDDRRDKTVHKNDKMEAVLRKLGQENT